MNDLVISMVVSVKRVLVAPKGTHGFDSSMTCCGEGEVKSLVSTLVQCSFAVFVKLLVGSFLMFSLLALNLCCLFWLILLYYLVSYVWALHFRNFHVVRRFMFTSKTIIYKHMHILIIFKVVNV